MYIVLENVRFSLLQQMMVNATSIALLPCSSKPVVSGVARATPTFDGYRVKKMNQGFN